MKTILLTNDDGVMALGIQHLKNALSIHYDVYTVAPDRERSAVSMALTINHPLRLKQIEDKKFSVDGTPSDCVNIALQEVLPQWPDFIVSGMNEGENLCEDIYFSGTVAGAFTGHMYGIPSLAVSLIGENTPTGYSFDYEAGTRFTLYVLEKLLPLKTTSAFYNLNIPPNTTKDSKLLVTYPGLKRYKPSVVKKTDPRGKNYYWIGNGYPGQIGEEGTDLHAVKNGNVSISPLRYSAHGHQEMKDLENVFPRT